MILLWVGDRQYYYCDTVDEAKQKIKDFNLDRWKILVVYESSDDKKED